MLLHGGRCDVFEISSGSPLHHISTFALIKIIHIITGLDAGGAETTLLRLLGKLDRNRFDCEVISLTDTGRLGREIEALEVPVRALGMRGFAPNPFHVLRLARYLRDAEPDVVQTWMYHANLIGGVASILAGNPPMLWSIRQTNVDLKSIKVRTYFVVRLGAWLSRHIPRAIVCNSEAGRRAHVALGYDASKFVLIPNGFDVDVFRPDDDARRAVRKELQLNPEAVLIGHIARFDPQKDHETFARAAGLVLRDHPEVQFLLCGPGVETGNRRLAGWLAEANVSDNCHLLGMRSEIARLTAALDIAASSSFGEGFANAIGEAMACGVPCVVTDAGDSAVIVSETGRVVAPRDPSALAAALSQLIDAGSVKRAELGRAARQRVADRYSLPQAVRRHEELYENTAGRFGAASSPRF